MHVKVTKNYGANAVAEVVIDQTTPKDGLAMLSFLLQPDYCGKCMGTKITLDSNVANTDEGAFVYLKRKCLNPKCKAQSTLGENKGNKGYFWKEWEIYVPKTGGAPAGISAPIPAANVAITSAPTPVADPSIEGSDSEGLSADSIPF